MKTGLLNLWVILLGALLTFSYAPYALWPLMPLCLVAFFATLIDRTPRQIARLSYLFGLGWFGAGISWVHVSIADFGGLPLAGSVGLMALLCAYLAVYPALALYVTSRVAPPRRWPLVLPMAWLIVEWLRSWMLSGFPWLSIGYSQIDSPLAGWMPVVGETGLSVLLVTVCLSVALFIGQRRFAPAALLGVVLFASGWVLNGIDWVTRSGESTRIAMVQGNIQQALRWVPEQDRPTMQKYQRMTEPLWDADVVIWPEAAVPKIEPTATNYLRMMDQQAAEQGSSLITGIVNYNFETREAFNNLIVLGKQQPDDTTGHYRYMHANRFDKHHLLPIGEFIPMEDWLRGLAPIFDLPMSSFSRGAFQQANLVANGVRFAPAICFEIAFPRQIRANLYADTDYIITVSNDAWFGDSHGPAQHLEIARVRARELGMPILRATNTGITAIIDERGHIQARLPQFEAAVVSDEVAKVTGSTPYRNWGEIPSLVFALVMLAIAFFSRQPQRQLFS